MPKFSANLSFLYAELPFLDRFAAAAADGFPAVEYVEPLRARRPRRSPRRCGDNGLAQALFNLPPGDWAGGERGIGCLPDRVEEFRASVDTAIRYGQALGCPKINCLAGIAPAGADPVDARGDARRQPASTRRRASPTPASSSCSSRSTCATSRASSSRPPTTPSASSTRVGSDNLYIQYDIYHTQVMQGDLIPTYARLKDRIAHIQIADNPGRNEPGTGEINYAFVLPELDRLGYDGYVGCEYKPKAGTSAGLGWMKPYI